MTYNSHLIDLMLGSLQLIDNREKGANTIIHEINRIMKKTGTRMNFVLIEPLSFSKRQYDLIMYERYEKQRFVIEAHENVTLNFFHSKIR